MPRNGSDGTYILSDTIEPDTLADANELQAILDDIATALTASFAADGQTSMTAPVKLANGTAAAPSITFATDTDTGAYRIGANNYGISVNGAKVVDVGTAGVGITGTLDVSGALTFGATTSIPLVNLSIVGGTSLTAPAVDDSLGIYDLSATANRKIALSDLFKVINGISSITPATDDVVPLYDTSGSVAGTATIAVVAASAAFRAMTRQYLTSGSSATYTTPTGAKTLVIKMIGGGAGGGARNTNNGTAGNDTSFNSIVAKGGSAGVAGTTGTGGAGGTGGSGSAALRINGSAGASAPVNNGTGGAGGVGPFGGGALVTLFNAAGSAAATNSGAGGSGAGANGASTGGGGGGAGEYVELVITSPSATYTYTVGAAANGGAAGGAAGGNGGSGLIIVEEYY